MEEGNVERSEIIPLLVNPRKAGDWIMSFCQSHPDGKAHQRRSLGLSSTGVLRCFAGCTFKDAYNALKARERVPLANITTFPSVRPAKAPEKRSKLLVATYEYRDPDNHLIAEKARFMYGDGTKTFRWRLPDAPGWDKDEGGGLPEGLIAEMPLWRSEKVAGWDPEDWIFFVEGEKAAEACEAHSLNVVTHGGGASTTEFGGSFEVLRDRNVALWPDNDEAGRRYMQRVAKNLKGIARSVRVVSVPVKEKGDAFDFFAEGGLPEDVFRATWDRPLVEFISAEHVRVTVYCELGPVAFDFEDLEHLHREINCTLTINLLAKGFEDEPYSLDIDILSPSKRDVLERQLKKHFGSDINWTLLVSQAYSRARKALIDRDRGVGFGSITEPEGIEYVVEGLIPRGQHTIVFGDGASGKTMWTYQLGLMVAMGRPLWGMPVHQGGVLIVDYETRSGPARLRMSRLIRGMGFDSALLSSVPIHYWPAKGVAIQDQVEALQRFIRSHDIQLVIVDSGGMACAGAPEDARAAIGYSNAIEKLDTTVVTICHISHTSDGFFPFGSKFWHNLARRTYFMKADGVGTDMIDLSFIPRKCSDGRRPDPMNFSLEFLDGFGGPIVVSLSGMRSLASLDDVEITDQVTAILAMAGDALVMVEIADQLHYPVATVEKCLLAHPDRFEFVYSRIGGKLWQVKAS